MHATKSEDLDMCEKKAHIESQGGDVRVQSLHNQNSLLKKEKKVRAEEERFGRVVEDEVVLTTSQAMSSHLLHNLHVLKDEGLFCEILKNRSGMVEAIPTIHREQIPLLLDYGDFIQIDGMHNACSGGMKLLVAVVIDRNNHTRLVAQQISCAESTDMIKVFLSFIKTKIKEATTRAMRKARLMICFLRLG